MKNEYQGAVSRKADRLKTAATLENVFVLAGAKIEVDRDDKHRDIYINGTVGPYEFAISLWAMSSLDCFMVHWYGKAQYPQEFRQCVQSINEYHHCKATGVHYTLDDLISKVSWGIRFLRTLIDEEKREDTISKSDD